MIRGIKYCVATVLAAVSLFSCAYASQTLTLSLEAPSLGSKAKSKQSAPASKPAKKKAVRNATVRIGHVGTVVVPVAYIYKSKSADSRKLASVKVNTPLAIVDEVDGWYGIILNNGAIGWMPVKNVVLTDYDLVANKTDVERGRLFSRGGYNDHAGALSNGLVQTAVQFSVPRYLFGGTNPSVGMDCSAFVRMIFSKYGAHLPRTAREQARVGQKVPFDQLQPGDRLYFSCRNPYIDHCGIYVGNGKFVHCSASRNGIGIDSLASDFFWRSLVIARRS